MQSSTRAITVNYTVGKMPYRPVAASHMCQTAGMMCSVRLFPNDCIIRLIGWQSD